jgi:DNA-binding CsgD family transcriptional regulator
VKYESLCIGKWLKSFFEVGETLMGLNNGKITIIMPIYSEKKNMDNFLPKDIINLRGISYIQKKSAKKAILWLLSKSPHSIEEIAEHFALSPELVNFLIQELMRSGKVAMETNQLRYQTSRQAFLADFADAGTKQKVEEKQKNPRR